jgi:hypothetical protein
MNYNYVNRQKNSSNENRPETDTDTERSPDKAQRHHPYLVEP